ncbi:DUF547 domain-containing protein [Endozoicomonas sp. SCSIO W0465]|uniref:DUF547 domain-containing protein n=1 Tax=Endozoicomonas sp. SCSIO W0465 TaxID=2918516 RepID=UPI0020761E0C|nr:DUF547 domain-containing protein [Endozoicomonas sp. SCSIO W0465]USE34944.1 DUF547 domain-containing protein [Endozoicomonas sp. SCSIO W0465]
MARCVVSALLLLFSLFSVAVQAVPSPDRWSYWDKVDKNSEKVVDHSEWQKFLDRYVKLSESTGMFMVEYGRVTKTDKERLDTYLHAIAQQDPRTLNRNEQQAYWINLYNALTVDLILDYYPVKSITRLGKGWFRMGPWKDELIKIAGQNISLHDIEHRILRPIWNNPRIHYALNCASIGCPDLLPDPFQGRRIDDQLADAARRFINQKKGAAFVNGRLVLSSIFDWYEDDFIDEDGVLKESNCSAPPHKSGIF